MTIPHLIEERAKQFGDKTFLFLDHVEYSYNTLHQNATRVAANLARRGVQPEDKVIVLMGNGIEFVYLFLGLGRIGAVLVPVNPTLKPDEIAYITANAEATTIITIPELAPLVPALRAELPLIQHVFVLGNEAADGAEPFDNLLEPVETIPEIMATEDTDASLIYTSGTTGKPKGVILTHGNYIWNARMVAHSTYLSARDRFLCILPLFHVNAQVVTLLTPLLAECDLVLMAKFNIFGVLPLIERHKVTIMSAVPTIYAMLCSIPGATKHDVSSMRFFVSGAAPMPEETYRATQRVLKKPLIMGYGLSEATCASAVADHADPIYPTSVGPALRYTSIRIVDKEDRDVPRGEVGEILVAGPAVMKGYYKNPEATAETLRNGWLHTGDLGRLDQYGYLYIVGRLKDMIIRGGQNIYPAEIEDVLSKLAGVEEACVVGVDEKRWGQQVLAVIKRAPEATLNEQDVLDFAREHLAPYKCPEYVRFITEFPKTPTGKIKKNLIAEQFAGIARNPLSFPS